MICLLLKNKNAYSEEEIQQAKNDFENGVNQQVALEDSLIRKILTPVEDVQNVTKKSNRKRPPMKRQQSYDKTASSGKNTSSGSFESPVVKNNKKQYEELQTEQLKDLYVQEKEKSSEAQLKMTQQYKQIVNANNT